MGAPQVGEHMLSLVQELEAFAASDALPDLLRVRGETRPLAATSAGWQALKMALEIPDVRGFAFCVWMYVHDAHGFETPCRRTR
jgi:hypothetical protein